MWRLHPFRALLSAAQLADEPGVAPFRTEFDVFCRVFRSVPKHRGMGTDHMSYEELQRLYHSGPQAKQTLYRVVCIINAGALDAESVEMLGDSFLYGLEKPDKSTRPIGVGSAIRRLAARVCILMNLDPDPCH